MELTAIITLTSEDARLGRPGSPEFCPVALAAKRALGMGSGIHVSSSRSITLDGFTIPLDQETGAEISRYDESKRWPSPTPRELRLSIPNGALHLLGRK